jgi:homoserine kinase
MNARSPHSTEDVLHCVSVPASTSNIGAGFDCLGLALDVWLDAMVVAGSGGPTYGGTLAGLDPQNDFVQQAVGDSLPTNVHLELESDIPVSRGLGASAAARVAGLVLARLCAGVPVDRDEVFADARELEGHPDNAAPAVYGGLVLDAGQPEVLELHETLGVALAIPERRISTDTARAILPPRLSREEAISQASRAASLLLGLTRGDGQLIRYGMTDVIAAPYRARLITGFDAAVQAAQEAGAFGATVSGAGSGIVAISEKAAAPTVADAMASALVKGGNSARAAAPNIVVGGFQITALQNQ